MASPCQECKNENTKIKRLRASLREIGSAAVAFSSGVDSTFLLRAAHEELRERAHEITERCVEKRFDFCSIINARSGRCSENCKWCAQSAHWKTGCETYGWVGTEACVRAAKEAEANGADRIGIVTSGRCLSPEDVENVCVALKAARHERRDGGEVHLRGDVGRHRRAAPHDSWRGLR